jgi:alpha-tubulin suppressor-like RCC1 family protein
MIRRFVSTITLAGLPVLAGAQTITLRADSARRVASPGEKVAVPVVLDMSAAAGTNLGSLTTGVTFAKSALTFDSIKAGTFGAVTPNTSGSSNGSLTLGVFDAAGTTTTRTLATMYFTASSTTGESKISFSPASAGSAAGASILALMQTIPVSVCVLPGGKWGDVNGDPTNLPLGDGNVDVIDAQQIARFAVGLGVGNASGLSARGDVNADGTVDIIDAQQIARYSVSLSAAARVGTFTFSSLPTSTIAITAAAGQNVDVGGRALRLTASARDENDVDVSYCATMAWSSSDPAIATVSSSGMVTGIAPGTATISASANGKSNSVSITVKPFAYKSLSAGERWACGITNSNVAYCWGNDGAGQVGDSMPTTGAAGPHDGRLKPVAVSGGLAFVELAAGDITTCGRTASGAAYCWGGNGFGFGALGDGSLPAHLTTYPTPVVGGLSFTSLSAGAARTCGLVAGGAAYCWGKNDLGSLGDGTTNHSAHPVAVAGGHGFTALTSLWENTCGLTASGEAYCWGQNGVGQLGDGTTTPRTGPVLVTGGLTFTTIAQGKDEVCGLIASGAAYCWGQLSSGGRSSTPVAVPGGILFTSLVAGGDASTTVCGLTAAGAAYCWGSNGDGNIGDNSTTLRTAPVAVAGGLVFTSLAAGWNNTCGITTTGAAYCWGDNFNGAIGDGTTTSRLVPTLVLPPG